MRRHGPASLVTVLLVALVLTAVPPVGRADAAEPYTLATTASYAVDVDHRAVAVTIEATFTNLTPDPPGEFSVFSEVPIAVHDAATQVTARDADGKLDVSVSRQKGGDGQPVNVATVALRKPLRLKKTAEFTLSYALPDGKQAGVRIRPSLVTFPVWSFGTSSRVEVTLPAAYEVRSDGDTLTAARDGETTTLSSGAIANPARWLAIVTADRQTPMTTAARTVPLDGGTVDLNVRSWADDAAWGKRTLDLLAAALPRLQVEIGLPYAGVGPLVVTETVPSASTSLGEGPAGAAQELQIAYDEPPFTVLHQAAHVWIDKDLLADRWLREGLASHYAARVARDLKIAAPYEPVKQAAQQEAAAFPLESWTDDGDLSRAAYGYPASWAFIDQLATGVGEDGLRTVLQRALDGTTAYQPGKPSAEPSPAAPAAGAALDSKRFLDEVEDVSGSELTAAFGSKIFGDASKALLAQRGPARSAYADLLVAAGDWGAPRPVREAMTDWRFDEATDQIAAARDWLGQRDDLVAAIERAGLSTPDRLRQPYETSGGGTDARVELQAERAVVEDYQAVLDRVNASHSFVQRIGLLGGEAPAELLASAHGRFADGDLRGAADAASQARIRLDSAETAGWLRLASATLIVLVALAAIAYLLRRRRTLARNVD